MGYIRVGKSNVFISHSRLSKLRSEALKNQTASFRVLSTVSEKAASKTADLMHSYLHGLWREDPGKFAQEWVSFDLHDTEASENVKDLLFDYCHLTKHSYLSEVRENGGFPPSHKATGTPPIGEIFALNHWIRPEKWWLRYTKRMKGREVSIFIDQKSIYQVTGTLEDFLVLGDNLCMRCAGHLSIFNKEWRGENTAGLLARGQITPARPLKQHYGMIFLLYFILFIAGLYLMPNNGASFDWGWIRGIYIGDPMNGRLLLQCVWLGGMSLSGALLGYAYMITGTVVFAILVSRCERQKRGRVL